MPRDREISFISGIMKAHSASAARASETNPPRDRESCRSEILRRSGGSTPALAIRRPNSYSLPRTA